MQGVDVGCRVQGAVKESESEGESTGEGKRERERERVSAGREVV
jgi:hypothetical protein